MLWRKGLRTQSARDRLTALVEKEDEIYHLNIEKDITQGAKKFVYNVKALIICYRDHHGSDVDAFLQTHNQKVNYSKFKTTMKESCQRCRGDDPGVN